MGSGFTSHPFGCFRFPESLRDRSEISGMPMASAGLAETRAHSLAAFIFSTWGLTGNLLWAVDCSSFALVFSSLAVSAIKAFRCNTGNGLRHNTHSDLCLRFSEVLLCSL